MKVLDTFKIKTIDRLMVCVKLGDVEAKLLENRSRNELFNSHYLCNEHGICYTIYGTEWFAVPRKPGVGDSVALAVDPDAFLEVGEEVHISTAEDVWRIK